MRRSRCPWCGEETINAARRSMHLRGTDDCCPNCGKAFFCGPTTRTLGYRILDYYFQIAFILIVVTGILSFLLLLIPIYEKYAFVPASIMAFVSLTLVPLYYLGDIKYSSLIKLDSDQRRFLPFTFTFRAQIDFTPHSEGGYWRYKRIFKENYIFGAEFKTEHRLYKRHEIALVFQDIKFGKDRTAECIVGFLLDHRIEKNFAQPGLEFTLIDNGRQFANGVITELLPEKIEKL